jgi:putative SOS response-associated peptidase YedK
LYSEICVESWPELHHVSGVDRMPVVLGSQDLIHAWLNDDLSESALHKLTQPYEGSDMVNKMYYLYKS